MQPEVGSGGIEGHDGIAVERQIDKRRRNDAASLPVRLGQHFPRAGGNEDMTGFNHAGIDVGSKGPEEGVVPFRHGVKEFVCGAAFARHHERHVPQCGRALLFGPRHDAAVQHHAREKGEGRLCPVILHALAVGIDQHERDILRILNGFKPRQAQLFQRVEGTARSGGVGRVESQHLMPLTLAPAGGQRPVFALDVKRDGRPRPGKQRRQNKAHALA